MLLTLLSHQWKAELRSSVFRKGLVLNMITGLLILYFGSVFLFLGFHIDDILAKAFPEQSPVALFNGALLYYFMIDLFFRFILQELPVLAVEPYLHLPIPKSKLVHFVLLKSVPSFFNLLPLLFLVPFMVSAVLPAYDTGVALVWLLALLAITLFNNFLLLYFKRQMSNKPLYTLAFGVAVTLLMVLEYLNALQLQEVSEAVFGSLLQQPWLIVVPVLLLAGVYLLNYLFLKVHTYPEELSVRKQSKVEGRDITFLNRFGEIGKLIELELKLVWRHKRPKSLVIMSVVFLFYGLMFYRSEGWMEGYAGLVFVGIFMTGMPMFNYGQFVPGWQSSHFDALLTRRISPYQFYAAKFWMFVSVVTLAFILTLPYGFLGYKIILINTAAFLFNIGVNVFVVFFFSVYNTRRLDLNKGSAFNWQGVGGHQLLMQLPTLLLPVLIYAPFGFMGVPYLGIAAIGLLGLIGFTLQKQLLQWSARWFVKHKYKLAASFRQD
ncbi:hypothetical protein CLV24_10532 [Pontibacter ummariensis]|uniref:ABC-2 type transport system permease protein n=1 Tax=Pontibacter ummariensis TaxID=1610492 RepID=A0A239E0N0_9BACT|nr:DUF5687 family protein [Pontibacter ummariensis]PRY13662.1 hypothetical protein CLV24_10532 [Pontibacter ummariensis]SNS38059.1 hypothetical protein SAMN06296052_105219 [Pontibacter ummariensis]